MRDGEATSLPFGLFGTDIEADFGVCLEGDEGEIGWSRRVLFEAFSGGLSGEGLAPLRGETPLLSLGLRGGVEGPEERVGDVGDVRVGRLEGGGSTETARNVSNSRALITFSSPVCEWSGKLTENGAVVAGIDEPVGAAEAWTERLREDVIELVRGR